MGLASHVAELAMAMPGAICMFGSGMAMAPPGVPVASLSSDPRAAGIRMCEDAAGLLPVFGTEAGGRPAAITISGPPATSATLSRTAVTPPAAVAVAISSLRRTRPVGLAHKSQKQPMRMSASNIVHSRSPKPTGSMSRGVGPTMSPTVLVRM